MAAKTILGWESKELFFYFFVQDGGILHYKKTAVFATKLRKLVRIAKERGFDYSGVKKIRFDQANLEGRYCRATAECLLLEKMLKEQKHELTMAKSIFDFA